MHQPRNVDREDCSLWILQFSLHLPFANQKHTGQTAAGEAGLKTQHATLPASSLLFSSSPKYENSSSEVP